MSDSDNALVTVGKIVLWLGIIIFISIYFILPRIIRDYDRPRSGPMASISSLRTINYSEVTYSNTYPEIGYACSLDALGPSLTSTAPSSQHAGLIDATLASGVKFGYRFAPIHPCRTETKNNKKIVVGYTWGASPIDPTKDERYFCTDEIGVIKFHLHSVEECLISGNQL